MIQKGKIPGLGAGNTVFSVFYRIKTRFYPLFSPKYPFFCVFKEVPPSFPIQNCFNKPIILFFLERTPGSGLIQLPGLFFKVLFLFNFLLRVGVISYQRRLLKRKTPRLEWLNRQVHRKRAGSALPLPGAERQKESFPVAPAPPRIR